MAHPNLLVLADGRFPAGTHAHSGGVEEAVASGAVHDIATLRGFLVGRLHTVGRADAALAAATASRVVPAGSVDATATVLRALDVEAAARTPSAALRAASRRLGRQLVRAAGVAWPGRWTAAAALAAPDGLHQPVATGLVARAAGLAPPDAAQLAAQGGLAAAATAAVRLLGLDPFAVNAAIAELADDVGAVVVGAVAGACDELSSLPAPGAPALEIGAEHHADWEVRLFAS